MSNRQVELSWVPIDSEQKPKNDVWCALITTDWMVIAGYMYDGIWYEDSGDGRGEGVKMSGAKVAQITHWFALPKLAAKP